MPIAIIAQVDGIMLVLYTDDNSTSWFLIFVCTRHDGLTEKPKVNKQQQHVE